MKYRKKPVVVHAWKWDESRKTLNVIGCRLMGCQGHVGNPDLVRNLRIKTLEGTMSVSKGDFIIKDVTGEFYPCKPDIFEMTYEKTEEDNVSTIPEQCRK